MSLQKKKYPIIYDYKDSSKCIINEYTVLNEDRRLDSLSTLTFEIPRYLFDYYGIPVLDDEGRKVVNPKIDFLINDNKVLFNGNYYVIKINEDVMDDKGAQYIRVTCNSIAYELQEKYVQFLNLSPPINDAVNVEDAFQEILEAAQQIRDNFVVSSTTTTTVLDADAYPQDDFYNGYAIKIIYGTGAGQERRITDYVASTKTVTVNTAWTTTPDITSVYRIWNDVWKVGTIDPAFLTMGGSPLLRGHKFDYATALEALNSAKNQYFDDTSDLTGYLTFTSTFSSGEWHNTVNLVQANAYTNHDIRFKKNMTGIVRKIDSSECYTKVLFEGKDNLTVTSMPTETRTDSSITYYTHISGYNEIVNFQYFLALGYTAAECFKNFIKEYKFEDTRYTSVSDMYADGKVLLERLSVPKITYSTTIKDLSTLPEPIDEEFDIGDTVKIYNEDLGIDVYATVITKTYDGINPQDTVIELSNYIERMSDMLNRILNKSTNDLNVNKVYGQSTTIVVADRLTSKNWRQADYVINAVEYASGFLNNIINDLVSRGIQGKIVLLEGEYQFNTTVYPKTGINIEGQGVGTRIYPSKNMGLAFNITTQSNITISNLFIDYHRQLDGTSLKYYFSNGIGVYTSSNNITVDNIIQEYVDNNMFIVISSSNITVKNSIFKSENLEFRGSNVIDMKACTNGVVDYCEIRGKIRPSNIGLIYLVPQTGVILGNFTVTNNYFYLDCLGNDGGAAIFISDLIEGSSKISNNNINVYNGALTWGVYEDNCSNISIKNNILMGSFHSGIEVHFDTGNNINVLNNIITMRGWSLSSNAGVGIEITGGTNPNIGNIQSNTVKLGNIYNSTYLPFGYGIWVKSGTVGCIVAHNDLNNSGVTSSFLDNGTTTQTLGGNIL